MNTILTAPRIVGAILLAVSSSSAYATSVEAVFKQGLSGTPKAILADAIGNVINVQSSTNNISLQKYIADGSNLWTVNVPGNDHGFELDSQGTTYVVNNFRLSYSNELTARLTKITEDGVATQIYYGDAGGSRAPNPHIALGPNELPHVVAGKSIYKFNTDGQKLWETRVSISNYHGSNDITVDSVGNTYVVYYTARNLPHRGVTPGSKIFKYSPDGVLLWSKSFSFPLFKNSLHVNSQDQLIVISRNGSTDVYLLDQLGNTLAQASMGADGFYVADVQLDHADNLVVVGGYAGQFATRKYDSNLVEMWTVNNSFDPLRGSGAAALDIDAQNNIYLTGNAPVGWHHTNAKFGTAMLDPQGNEVWKVWENQGHSGYGSQIAVDTNGNAYVTGPLKWFEPYSTLFVKYGLSNQPPVANAGTYAAQECTGALTQVNLDGSASSDPDGDLLSYSWSGVFGAASGATPTVGLPLGNNSVSLTVDDGNGMTDTATANILVQDTTPPLIDAGADQVVIAQNATGAPFTLNYGVSDACGGTNVTVDPLLASYPIGSNLITATATDDSGNVASDAMTLTVAYASGDFLPPLKVGGVYKLGRTLPVKFQLFYADGSLVTTATPTLQLQQLNNSEPVGEPIDPQSSATTEPSNGFRFADDHYIYNLDTSTLSKGSYRLLVDLGDGNGYKTFDIGLK